MYKSNLNDTYRHDVDEDCKGKVPVTKSLVWRFYVFLCAVGICRYDNEKCKNLTSCAAWPRRFFSAFRFSAVDRPFLSRSISMFIRDAFVNSGFLTEFLSRIRVLWCDRGTDEEDSIR